MDQAHDGGAAPPALRAAPLEAPADVPLPQDDDERFIVGLVLTYYRRHPDRARTRLLDLLGEVLVTATASAPRPAPPPARKADDTELWQRTRAGIAPLKRK
jgi:hypothetical protein